MLAPRRCMKPRPLAPSAQTSISSPCPCHALYSLSTMRSRLVLSPPHRPLSVVTTMIPTRFTESRSTRKGWRYSGLACEICAATVRIFSPYGRAWRMRSCAFLILEAATISIALVILRVFCTLRILTRISLVPGMAALLVGPVLLPVRDRGLQRLLVVGGQVLLVLHGLHQRGVPAL